MPIKHINNAIIERFHGKPVNMNAMVHVVRAAALKEDRHAYRTQRCLS